MTANINDIIKRFGYGKHLNIPISFGNDGVYKPETEVQFNDNIAELLIQMANAQRAKDTEEQKNITQKSFAAFVKERVRLAINSPIGFHERLVHFWSNHFAISTDKRTVTINAGHYEFYAIRPNINNSFRDLLIAAITHPAMLEYLDQEKSIGPNSIAAQNAAKNNKEMGLNENLAREILELHTLGVNGGYTQKDVTEFAKALTGFGYKKPKPDINDATIGQFVFFNQRHENGAVIFMGQNYSQSGYAQAAAIIEYIANHPNTAGFIAYKLARHFCTDSPPPELVNRLKLEFLKTNGNLNSLYDILLNSKECFNTQTPKKFKTPWDWYIYSLRGLGITNIEAQSINQTMKTLGQEIFKPKSPKGYDDTQNAWAAPDAILKRAEIANLLVRKYLPPQNQDEIINIVFGQDLSEQTKKVLSRAESKQSALSLLLISPENMRR